MIRIDKLILPVTSSQGFSFDHRGNYTVDIDLISRTGPSKLTGDDALFFVREGNVDINIGMADTCSQLLNTTSATSDSKVSLTIGTHIVNTISSLVNLGVITSSASGGAIGTNVTVNVGILDMRGLSNTYIFIVRTNSSSVATPVNVKIGQYFSESNNQQRISYTQTSGITLDTTTLTMEIESIQLDMSVIPISTYYFFEGTGSTIVKIVLPVPFTHLIIV